MEEARLALLAERHRKVLRLYGQRYRLKEIGRELALSENSVNTYLTEAVQILGVGGRRAAADALARAETPSQFQRYHLSAPDTAIDGDQAPELQPAEALTDPPGYLLPLRPKSGVPNALPVHVRLLWMLGLLIASIIGVAFAVAAYTVYVKPMEHLLR